MDDRRGGIFRLGRRLRRRLRNSPWDAAVAVALVVLTLAVLALAVAVLHNGSQ